MRKKNYSKAYSEPSLWRKLGSYALTAGKEIVEKVLTLFETLKDPDTPAWARAAIIAALGYFISPLDAIPDPTPVIGFSDDWAALIVAFATVLDYVKDEHVSAARLRLQQWFGKASKKPRVAKPR